LLGAPQLPSGVRGTLDIDGFAPSLPVVVRHGEPGSLHLAFVLDEALAAKFSGMPERLAQRQVA
jgi:hypothetical protein